LRRLSPGNPAEALGNTGVASAGFVKLPQAEYTVRVVYDPARITQAALLTTIAAAPGSAGGSYGAKVLSDAPAA